MKPAAESVGSGPPAPPRAGDPGASQTRCVPLRLTLGVGHTEPTPPARVTLGAAPQGPALWPGVCERYRPAPKWDQRGLHPFSAAHWLP